MKFDTRWVGVGAGAGKGGSGCEMVKAQWEEGKKKMKLKEKAWHRVGDLGLGMKARVGL